MGRCREAGATLSLDRHRGTRLKLENGKISLGTGKKHFALQCGHAVEQLAQQGCDISISEAVQNTTGQFPEQSDLNGFSSQQKAELHGPPEVPANIN